MLRLPDHWVWDSWFTHDGSRHHAFFLQAPRSLGDPELRHRNAGIGHAVSDDLISWTYLDSLRPQPQPAFDDLATWTGCVVRGDDGLWRMFTTGLSHAEEGMVQRVGVATSTDLTTWQRSADAVVQADPRWYAVRTPEVAETHWRDPWVVRDDAGLWHLYMTARARGTDQAVVGHAVSTDLVAWEVRAPLSAPSERFGWAEVISVQCVEGRWVLVFACLGDQIRDGSPGGCWVVEIDGPGTPVDLDAAYELTSPDLYVAKLVPTSEGWRLLAFLNRDDDGEFAGVLIDPLPVGWDENGALALLDGPAQWRPARSASAGASITTDRPARTCR